MYGVRGEFSTYAVEMACTPCLYGMKVDGKQSKLFCPSVVNVFFALPAFVSNYARQVMSHYHA